MQAENHWNIWNILSQSKPKRGFYRGDLCDPIIEQKMF
jgi:hypothetical protein